MKIFTRVLFLAVLFSGVAFMSGCESDEEKAAKIIKEAEKQGEKVAKEMEKAAKNM